MCPKPLILPFTEIFRVPKKSQKKAFDATRKRFRKKNERKQELHFIFERRIRPIIEVPFCKEVLLAYLAIKVCGSICV